MTHSVCGATRTDSSSQEILTGEILVKYLWDTGLWKLVWCNPQRSSSQWTWASESVLGAVQTAQAEPGYAGLGEQNNFWIAKKTCSATLEWNNRE